MFGESGPAVLLLHGGGQTRHSWRADGRAARAIGIDRLCARSARPWRFRVDRRTAATRSPTMRPMRTPWPTRSPRAQGARPVVIGASLGGIAALLAEGGAARSGRERAVLGARPGRHHAAGRSRWRRQDPGLHARARDGRVRLDRRGRRCGRRLSAAPAAAALLRRIEEEPAARSRTAAGAGTGIRASSTDRARSARRARRPRPRWSRRRAALRCRPCWCAGPRPSW